MKQKHSKPSQKSGHKKPFGITFNNKQLLELALTHSSYANEQSKNLKESTNNERLEFLGDAVLDTVVSEELFKKFPKSSEGELSKLRAALVNTVALAKKATHLDLANHLHLGQGLDQGMEKKQKTLPKSILANTFEALIGAVFLDKGYSKTSQWLLKIFKEDLGTKASPIFTHDSKSKLQEQTQKKYKKTPTYHTKAVAGPAHQRLFTSRVTLLKKVLGEGKGHSKKEAEQDAAKDALAKQNLW